MKFIPLLLIKFYKLVISPYWPGQCRYEPTCSVYAADAIQKHGIFTGIRMAASRIGRCQPAFDGGYDPVPDPRAAHSHDPGDGDSPAEQPLT
ncbi:MAG: membrane protein insertion efficiency factor YidD [Chloroflexi bacterium]|nr:membrane protein insertion efficiency factor YidD [Chloroflexota bacterium]MCH8102757.1 membrane protein insertion efficiency factor YidD [Chloroflexota bacterium]